MLTKPINYKNKGNEKIAVVPQKDIEKYGNHNYDAGMYSHLDPNTPSSGHYMRENPYSGVFLKEQYSTVRACSRYWQIFSSDGMKQDKKTVIPTGELDKLRKKLFMKPMLMDALLDSA